MLIVPISTDAPIYHYPIATVGMIVSNIVIFGISMSIDPDLVRPYLLVLGEGVHPVQWLTHNFLHAGIMHLLGNMIFLWAYGIIVEGKIGPLLFLLSYLGIGFVHGGAIQLAYLGAEEPGQVLGASAIIFGLMAMAMIWAPMNDLTCFYLFIIGFRILSGQWEVHIYIFAILQLVLEGLEVGLSYAFKGDPMSSGLLHISGAFWGVLVGIVFVKAGWVDCEGWDVFSLRKKKRELGKAWKAREERLDRSKAGEVLSPAARAAEDRPGVTPEERAEKLLAKTLRSISVGDYTASEASFEKWIKTLGNKAPRDALMCIIQALLGRDANVAAVPPMRALCKFHPEKCERVRLKLAGVLVRELDRPTEAKRHLDQIPDRNLDPKLLAIKRKLLAEAEVKIEEGVMELEED